MLSTTSILEENEKRKQKLFAPYDPVTGVGSLVPRVEFYLNDTKLLVPKAVSEAFSGYDTFDDADLLDFFLFRTVHDFEWWASTCVIITDKEPKQGEELIKFRLRYAQRILLSVLITDFENGVPMRVVLLKARQWGGSTLIQLFMAWLQIFHFSHWNSVIVTDVEQQAINIRAMYTLMAQHHPKEIFPVKLGRFEGSSKNKILHGREAVISIASMQRPENMRSANLKLAHMSEVASWKPTINKKPEDVTQTIRGSILRTPGTLIAVESTAKGSGNFFHSEWKEAVLNPDGYRPVFIPWFFIEMYYKPIPKDKMVGFVETLSEYGKTLWELGATLEGINWYFNHKVSEKFSDWRMNAEFPSTPEEAFSSTNRRAFNPYYIKQLRNFNCKPVFVGDVFADSVSGEKCLVGMEFREVANGELWIWEMPENEKIANRYVIAVDIGGRSYNSDYSIIRVLDRIGLIEGDVPRAVLTWRGRLDQDLVVWKALQIAKLYNNALLVYERNSIKKDEELSEGDHTVTLLDTISDYYDNIFTRTNPERIKRGLPALYGYFTSHQSKTDLVTNGNKVFRENLYIEYDGRVCDEYDQYEIKPGGRYGNIDGGHDDLVMATLIMLKVSELMDLPVRIEKKAKKIANKPLTEASF